VNDAGTQKMKQLNDSGKEGDEKVPTEEGRIGGSAPVSGH
jgi:hypothetical protein